MNIFFKEYGGLVLGIFSVVLSMAIFSEVLPSVKNIVNSGIEEIFGQEDK